MIINGITLPDGGGMVQLHRGNMGAVVDKARETGKCIGGDSADWQWGYENLENVIDLSPSDMLITVETGMTLAQIQSIVSAKGLWLPLDAPGFTGKPLANIIAEDGAFSWLSGRYGLLKEWVMAMTVLNDEGAEVKFGAPVSKNTAGYQLAPLYCGANHLLGPVVEVTFRLIPHPRQLAVVSLETDSIEKMLDFWLSTRTRGDLQSAIWMGIRFSGNGGAWKLEGLVLEQSARNMVTQPTTISRVDSVVHEPGYDMTSQWACIQLLPSQIASALQWSELREMVVYPEAGMILVEQEISALEERIHEMGGRIGGGFNGSIPIDERHLFKRVKDALDPQRVFGTLL